MIAIACDHGGYELKLEIIKHLQSNNIDFVDFGTNDTNAVDYPDYAKQVSQSILQGECTQGILICGTGIGISMSANRYKGIRCALCHDVFSAKATREHNDANILALGARVVGAGHALMIVDTFLNTPFSNEQRHIDRINKIEL